MFVKWTFWMFVRRWVSDRTFPWPVLCLSGLRGSSPVLTPEPAVYWQKLTVCSPGSEHVTLLGWSEISEAADSLSALHFHKSLSLFTLNWQISKWDSECGTLMCTDGGNMMFLLNCNHSLFFWLRATRTANPGNDHGLLGDRRDVQTSGARWAPRFHLGEERSPQLVGSSLRLLTCWCWTALTCGGCTWLPVTPGRCTCDCGGGRRVIFDVLTSLWWIFFLRLKLF